MVTFDLNNKFDFNVPDLDNNLSFGEFFVRSDNNLFVLDSEDYLYDNNLFWDDLYLQDIDNNISNNNYWLDLSKNDPFPNNSSWQEFIENIDLSNLNNTNLFYLPENSIDTNSFNNWIRDRINSYISNDAIVLEVTNTLDTNVIDESDGLSLGEAIQIANNDPENSYAIEIPGGSYDVTLDEDFELVGSITIVSQDEERKILNFTRAEGDRVAYYDINGSLQIPLDIVLRNFNNDSDALQLTGETAQIAYVAYYGRPGDPAGLTFWQDSLSSNKIAYSPRRGDSLTGSELDVYNDIVTQFGNSAEADRLFGTLDNNRERVNRVYQFAFDREADASGSNYWTEQLDNGNVTLVNFALEVALGAQGEDIVTLNNKIASANLFSESIDTEAEITAYSGSSGEVFGRDWLDDVGAATSTQAQVDSALDRLVDLETI